METKELKFLLKLIGRDDYCGKLADLKPNTKTTITETQSICRGLRDRELVECSETITKIKINSAGKALLKLDANSLPINSDELKILKACTKATITPGKIKLTPADKRNKLIASLAERGLIAAAATKIEKVWISDRGKQELAIEYCPKGNQPVISLSLLNNYVVFLRKYYRQAKEGRVDTNNLKKPSDREILETIINLDNELGTDNYLPIFHLRNRLQPPLSRTELDNALYRLQKEDKLELSSLVEAMHYTKEQMDAGIAQDVGGALFFLTVN